MVLNAVHLQKALLPIDFTERGISICSNDEQLLNAKSPIVFKEEGSSNEISFKAEQQAKAYWSIIFKEAGKDICANEEHPLKAEVLIVVREEGETNKILVNEEHSRKAYSSIIVNEAGNTISFNILQLQNAFSSIVLIIEGIESCVIDEQSWNENLLIEVIDVERICICCNKVHSLNTNSPNSVRLEEFNANVNALHLLKA